MRVLSKKEFKEECERLQLKGKCAVLLNGIISKESTEKKELQEFRSLKHLNDNQVQSMLINFLVSPRFLFSEFEKRILLIHEYIPHQLDVVVTVTYDNDMSDNKANITVMISKQTRLMVFMKCLIGYINKLKCRG